MNSHQDDTTYFLQCLDHILNMDDVLPTFDYSKLNGNGETIRELAHTHKNHGRPAATEQWRKILAARPEYAAMVNQRQTPTRRVLHADSLETLPPVQFLIDGKIVAGALNEVHGAAGSGKSFYVLNEIAAPLSKNHTVIYVAGEGVSGYADRYRAWLTHHKPSYKRNLYFDTDPVNLMDDQAVDDFIEHYRQLAPKLIIFDTFARCLVGGDENSARDVGLAIHNLGRIQSLLSTAVLIVHHTGKAGNMERGSSALRGACDSMIEITNDDGLITVSSSKLKDGKPFTDLHYRFIDVPLSESRSSVVLVPAEKVIDMKGQPLTKQQREILNFLSLPNFIDIGAKANVIQQSTGIPNGSIFRVLGTLMRLEYVTRGEKGDPYSITGVGQLALQAKS